MSVSITSLCLIYSPAATVVDGRRLAAPVRGPTGLHGSLSLLYSVGRGSRVHFLGVVGKRRSAVGGIRTQSRADGRNGRGKAKLVPRALSHLLSGSFRVSTAAAGVWSLLIRDVFVLSSLLYPLSSTPTTSPDTGIMATNSASSDIEKSDVNVNVKEVQRGEYMIDSKAEKRLVRKLDLLIMPSLALAYLVTSLDVSLYLRAQFQPEMREKGHPLSASCRRPVGFSSALTPSSASPFIACQCW